MTVITKPVSERYHFDLNDGLYEGDEPKWLRNDIRQREPYVTRKNMDIISATVLTLPNRTNSEAISNVTSVVFTGSPSWLLADESHLLSLIEGNEVSFASACRVLGATMSEPRAAVRVVAARPRGIITAPPMAIFPIISWSARSSSGEAEMASFQITRM